MKNQKGFIVSLLGIFIALLLGGGGYIAYKKISSKKIESVTSTTANTVSTTTQDVSDWKTYRNEELGFELKYPNSWVSEKTEKILALINADTDATIKKLASIDKGFYYDNDLLVGHYNSFVEFLNEQKNWGLIDKNLSIKNLNEFIESKDVHWYSGGITKISIGGMEGYYGIESAPVLGGGPIVMVEKNNGLYVIRLTKNDSIRNIIISTFKFTK